MITTIETEFYVTPNKCEPLYIICDSVGSYLAFVYRTYRIEQTMHQYKIGIDYELQFNVCKNFNANERRTIKAYFDNLVSMLTHDIQTLFTDNIDERIDLPFYRNIIHIKLAD